MNFFQEFITDIKSIGAEFADRFRSIPENGKVVVEYLPTALTGFLVVLSMLALIAIVILVFSKVMALASKSKGAKEAPSAPAVSAAPAGTPLPANASAGSLDLVDVDEKTAAVIMAIVSKESGIPLNRLSFKSIKRMEDK